jgi:hypothetical protein
LRAVYAAASTTHRVQGETSTDVIVSIDRESVTHISKKELYVGTTRARTGIHIFVESIADLSQSENRSGDRTSATDMTIAREVLPAEIQILMNQVDEYRAERHTYASKNLVEECIKRKKRSQKIDTPNRDIRV